VIRIYDLELGYGSGVRRIEGGHRVRREDRRGDTVTVGQWRREPASRQRDGRGQVRQVLGQCNRGAAEPELRVQGCVLLALAGNKNEIIQCEN